MSEQFTPQEQFFIERLRRAPQPELNQAVFEAIRVRVLDAVDAPPVPTPQPALPPTTMIIAIMVAVVAVIIALIVSQQNQPSAAPTLPAVTASPSATPTATETVRPAATISPTPAPTFTAVATIENVTVIEGRVEAINGNVITIFGVQVQVAPDDPLLTTIQVGDVIRVEGNTQTSGDTVIIIAITIIQVNVDTNVNPSSGEIWRDDGSCLNSPPDWAPAHGWRRRCQGGDGNSGKNGGGAGDDDDDD